MKQIEDDNCTILLPDDPQIGNKYSIPGADEEFVVVGIAYNHIYPSTIEYFRVFFLKDGRTELFIWYIFVSLLIKNKAILEKRCPIIFL
tara:strand:- start:1036 stop:1302 length:267 start_codon:yes stop_codon:yes gene_type:complete